MRWPNGVHLRPAAVLVSMGRRFSSTVNLCVGGRKADLRNILGIISLCAVMGTTVIIEANGVDEDVALQAVERAFSVDEDELISMNDYSSPDEGSIHKSVM